MSVPELLLGSLDPTTRLAAERQLNEAARQAGFVPHLLTIVLDKGQRSEVRIAAAVYLKNAARRRWADEEEPIPDGDKDVLRAQLVPAMLALSTSGAERTDRLARPQLADALAAIAAEDYPERWPTLITQLTASLSESDLSVNVGVLEAAHAVCAPWKSQVRSDALFATINSVVGVLGEPLLAMFRHVTGVLLAGAPGLSTDQHAVLAQTLHLLLCLYADLVDQDIPPVFEDSVPEFFGDAANEGLFLKILAWSPDALKGDVRARLSVWPVLTRVARGPHADARDQGAPGRVRDRRAVCAQVQRAVRGPHARLCPGRVGAHRPHGPRSARGRRECGSSAGCPR
jgi:exportin-2 (importin alpha re-exporter)